MILKRSAETSTQINTCREQNAKHYTRKARTPKDYFILYYYMIYYLIIKRLYRTQISGVKVQNANHDTIETNGQHDYFTFSKYIFTSDVLKSSTRMNSDRGIMSAEC